jgi:hypothetical protein
LLSGEIWPPGPLLLTRNTPVNPVCSWGQCAGVALGGSRSGTRPVLWPCALSVSDSSPWLRGWLLLENTPPSSSRPAYKHSSWYPETGTTRQHGDSAFSTTLLTLDQRASARDIEKAS